MGLTYDGITYRSLEEQVRYDAEQVQLLKQADVTINENLQTKINGKLTKPANPSAESAVTMLADGTVGTKPLSEIGGGKLYIHNVYVKWTADVSLGVHFNIYSSDNTSFSFLTLPKNPDIYNFGTLEGVNDGVVSVVIVGNETNTALNVNGCVYNKSTQAVALFSSSITSGNLNTIRDIVTEL